MAFCDINDINLFILSWISDFKLFINSSHLNKKSYKLIINAPIYDELIRLKIFKMMYIGFNHKYIIYLYHELGLINILKNLKRNNKCVVLGNAVTLASRGGHIHILAQPA